MYTHLMIMTPLSCVAAFFGGPFFMVIAALYLAACVGVLLKGFVSGIFG